MPNSIVYITYDITALMCLINPIMHSKAYRSMTTTTTTSAAAIKLLTFLPHSSQCMNKGKTRWSVKNAKESLLRVSIKN